MARTAYELREPGCKINLFLQIIARRSDGYHELESLFYPLSRPTDRLYFSPGSAASGLSLSCSDPCLNTEHNSIHTAYTAFVRESGVAPDLQIHLEKRVPYGAGLGGGSADAACVLQYLHAHTAPDMDPRRVEQIAMEVGADVPFFLTSKPCWVRGLGELLEPVPLSLGQWRLLLVCPELSVNTGWAYQRWDAQHQFEQNLAEESLTWAQLAYKECCSSGAFVLFNSFEQVVFPQYPELRELKQALLVAGVSACVMSGSGASLVALTREPSSLQSACSILEARGVSFFVI
ncbi:MAG: 4-(cytidine 5'-diphospho)-2-C-methyl-D-erythritol kinase [Thermodesulfobacteriota bacterium]